MPLDATEYFPPSVVDVTGLKLRNGYGVMDNDGNQYSYTPEGDKYLKDHVLDILLRALSTTELHNKEFYKCSLGGEKINWKVEIEKVIYVASIEEHISRYAWLPEVEQASHKFYRISLHFEEDVENEKFPIYEIGTGVDDWPHDYKPKIRSLVSFFCSSSFLFRICESNRSFYGPGNQYITPAFVSFIDHFSNNDAVEISRDLISDSLSRINRDGLIDHKGIMLHRAIEEVIFFSPSPVGHQLNPKEKAADFGIKSFGFFISGEKEGTLYPEHLYAEKIDSVDIICKQLLLRYGIPSEEAAPIIVLEKIGVRNILDIYFEGILFRFRIVDDDKDFDQKRGREGSSPQLTRRGSRRKIRGAVDDKRPPLDTPISGNITEEGRLTLEFHLKRLDMKKGDSLDRAVRLFNLAAKQAKSVDELENILQRVVVFLEKTND